MPNTHWHAGRNVSGYLSESDEPNTFADWRDAMSSLVSDLESVWDYTCSENGSDAQYLYAHTVMHDASPNQEFLIYIATHADSDHDIPTAWWITPCQDESCDLTGED